MGHDNQQQYSLIMDVHVRWHQQSTFTSKVGSIEWKYLILNFKKQVDC